MSDRREIGLSSDSIIEETGTVFFDPHFLQQQFNLPKEQWDEKFHQLIREKSEENQRAIQEAKRELAGEVQETSQETIKESPEIIRERTFKRYMNGLGLDKDSLKEKRLLDLGSGQGEFVEYLIQQDITQEAYGLDANPEELSVKEEMKSHLFQGDFQKELPVKNLDYIVSLGAVSNAVWGGEEVQSVENIVKSSLAALKENGEIRIYPIQEATKDSALNGTKESYKKWIELLQRISESEKMEYSIKPRDIKVIGRDNDIILESVLVIKKISEK